ncbi:MAG: hypothetical protein QXY55_03655 [Candidatus Korarchaeota archaeon]|nr:hypothetical protein [Thermoproteota archaeon]MCR8471267.1 hypothetical protein [Thermoproteota archaeon]MCR8471907.1 hypothetical protein [Thermoproteota archaeon]MCR8473346.1 hypothetical protein [Thermoproteota archaeon]MCR8488212.1 hypothetical protein [Thermoproteota archaeon]
MLFKKKKNLNERIRRLIERLQDARITIKIHRKKYENQIKKYLSSGKTPPASLLAAWKVSDVLLSTIDSSIVSLESAQMILEVRGAISEATGSVNVDKLTNMLQELNQNLASIGLALRQMVSVQNQLVNTTQSISTNLSEALSEISGLLEEVTPEVIESIGSEFLEQLKVNDPELYSKIPEEIKRKYAQSSGE